MINFVWTGGMYFGRHEKTRKSSSTPKGTKNKMKRMVKSLNKTPDYLMKSFLQDEYAST